MQNSQSGYHDAAGVLVMAYLAFSALVFVADQPWQRVACHGAATAAALAAFTLATSSTFRIALALCFWLALANLFFAAGGVTPAKAQNAPTYRSPAPCFFHCDEAVRRARRARAHYHEERHRQARKVWRHEAIADPKCQPNPLAAVGDQYATEQGAQQEADKAWMQTARWQFGERYMSRENAGAPTYECGRSSVGSVVGQTFTRCRLVAYPCRAGRESGDR
jgi:hypothetical protein